MLVFLQDLRYAFRQIRKDPGLTVVAVVTLALGIGANAAIFSILDPLLLRKLPIQNPDELVWVNSSGSLGAAETSEASAFYTYRDKNRVFSGVIAFAPETVYDIPRNGLTNDVRGEIVSGNYFTVLGVHPFIGRLLTTEDELAGRPVVVLSFDYWRRAFGSDRAMLGKVLPIKNLLYTIVGVAPPEFFGVEVGKSPDFYLPLSDAGPTREEWVQILARLKPGVSLAQAQASLEPLFEEVAKNSSVPEVERGEVMARLILTGASRGLSELRTQFSVPVWIMMAVVGLVLLIACSNVASLLLTKGVARRREISVRQALGAGLGRLVRQLLTESALLVALGGVAGLLLAKWASSSLIALISTDRFPVALAAGVSDRLLLFEALVLGLTVVLCGLAPALSATRTNLANGLKMHPAEHAPAGRLRLGSVLVVAQVTLAVVLLVGASLLLRSLVNLETFDAGFDRDHVLLVSISRQEARRSPAQMMAFYNQAVEDIRNLPGVRSASYSGFTPVSGSQVNVNVAVEGYVLGSGETANDPFVGVSPSYFNTLGIPLLQGRDFTTDDMQAPPRVAIINRTMARRFFGDRSPLGKRFRFVEGTRPPLEIIGVTADSKYNDLRENASDFFYVPSSRANTIEVRTSGNPKLLTTAVREVIRSLENSATVNSIKTLREQVDESLHSDHLIAGLCGTFSALALILASVGVYGTLSFRVKARTSEIGIRMALGAQPRDIFRLVVGQGLVMALAGLLVGGAIGVASASLLQSLLFGVKQSDSITLVGVSVLLVIATILACYIPARQAASVEPMQALRAD